jgi:hypothetical protein
LLAALAGLVGLLLTLSGCGTATYRDASTATRPDCDDRLNDAFALERSGQSGNGHDALSDTLETMRISCPTQLQVFNDYVSGRTMVEQFGPDTCSELVDYFESRAIQLLHKDGVCAGGSSGEILDDRNAGQPGGGIAWSDASLHVGSVQRVCGPLAGIGGSADDVFLNIGRDYPDPDRFTIVIWDIGGVEPIEPGTTTCTSGEIVLFEGVAQIHLRSPGEVELYR